MNEINDRFSAETSTVNSIVFVKTVEYIIVFNSILKLLRIIYFLNLLQNKSVLPTIRSQKINNISQVGTSFQSVNMPISEEQSSVRKRKFQGQLINHTTHTTQNHKPQHTTTEQQRQTPQLTTESCQSNTISNHIVLGWVDTLEKLDPMQRLFAKKAINDVLFEAQLGNLHKHSVKINEPLSSHQLSSSAQSPQETIPSPSYEYNY